jgi:hypothetical protein
MKREDVLKEMREAVGTKEPVEFFAKMTDMFTLLFDRIDQLEGTLKRVKTQSALAIQWEPTIASDMLAKQVQVLRQDKETFTTEIEALKQAYAQDVVTQNYQSFCDFWENTLGWHPFLD